MFKSRKLKGTVLLVGSLFASLFLFLGVAFTSFSTPTFADPVPGQEGTTTQDTSGQTSNSSDSSSPESAQTINTCSDESGGLGWIVCPATGFLAKITDSLYDIIEQFLIISPLSATKDNPYHQVWSIFRDITNVVFVIFLLVVIYSQITGAGISNYGIKKALPKIVVSAVLINLSFIICTLLVDISNIAGASIRSLFTGIESSITATGIIAESTTSSAGLSYTALVGALTGGAALVGIALGATGGLGYIFFSLLAVLLGAALAILVAFITIAARQALVYLLIMISPLAFVCFLLPNTEGWFNKWKKTLFQMLFFYPIFAALFGACSLVGWVIIAAAETPIMVILGMAVKVVPLFAAWSLLKMSGTLPGQIGSAVHGLTRKPLGSTQAFLGANAALRRAKFLGENAKPYQHNRRLAQFLQEGKYKRAIDTKIYEEAGMIRNQARASRLTGETGKVTRRAREIQRLQTQNLRHKAASTRWEKIADDGLSSLAAPNTKAHSKLLSGDLNIMNAADELAMEMTDAETVRWNNAVGRHNRFNDAVEAHVQSTQYNRPVDTTSLTRYNRMLSAARGNVNDVQYIAADAAQSRAVEDKIRAQKYDTYFRTLPPTQDLYNRLVEITGEDRANDANIDTILTGVRALGQRGDTDLVKEILDRVVESGQIKLGSHASQSLANYLMFDMGGKDVTLRRYGKYINLETARVFNEGQSGGKRINDTLSFKEYITGKYVNYIDEAGVAHYEDSKRDIVKLLEGTSLDDVERTAYSNLDSSLRKAFTDASGVTDLPAMQKRRAEIQNALLPAFIGANLKYLSGSEQIQNAAEFLTGLRNKDGVWIKRWEKEGDALQGLEASYFEEQVNKYITAQTPTQIFSLRTDLFNPVKEILANERENELRNKGELPEGYDDLEGKERKEARDALAKSKFQELLDSRGNLETIFMSRTSGAANNAKAVIREFLDINDEGKIVAFLKKRRQERKIRQKIYEETHDDVVGGAPSIFEDSDRQYFQDRVTSLFDENPDDTNFFDNSYKLVKEEFGQNYIARRYEEYHINNPDASNGDLLSVINDLLSNPENY